LLQEVALGDKALADYTHLCGRELIERIRELAEPLEGRRVLHVSATAFGGGVSEILYTLVPLMRNVGLDTHWQVIMGQEEFFNATKVLHNALQGDETTLSDEQWELFDRVNELNGRAMNVNEARPKTEGGFGGGNRPRGGAPRKLRAGKCFRRRGRFRPRRVSS